MAAAQQEDGDSEFDLESMLVPRDIPYVRLECEQAFATLSEAEKLYTHHLSMASWHGAAIVLAQTSVESPLIFDLLLRLLSRPYAQADAERVAKGSAPGGEGCQENAVVVSFEAFVLTHVSEVPLHECATLVEYAAYFFANLGNYLRCAESTRVVGVERSAHAKRGKSVTALCFQFLSLPLCFSFTPSCLSVHGVCVCVSACVPHRLCGSTKWSFGDSKFVPRFPLELFEKLVAASDKHFDDGHSCSGLLRKVHMQLYGLSKQQRCLALPPDGVSAYYSPDIRAEDIQFVNDFLAEQNLNPYNQRLFKVDEKHFIVR
jgi:Peptidase family M49